MKKLSLVRCGSEMKNNNNTPKKSQIADLNIHNESSEIAENIPIKYITGIEEKRNFEYLIYESYKPNNLREMK